MVSYMWANHFFCKSHAKCSKYLIPTAELAASSHKRTKLHELVELASAYEITYPTPARVRGVRAAIEAFIDTKVLTTIKNKQAGDMDLVTVGKVVMEKFDQEIRYGWGFDLNGMDIGVAVFLEACHQVGKPEGRLEESLIEGFTPRLNTEISGDPVHLFESGSHIPS